MRALVTGANGFVGSHLVDHLLEHNVAVRALVRESSDLRHLAGKDIEIVHADLGDLSPLLARAVSGVDLVYHVAGATKALHRRTLFRVNASGTGHLLAACLAATTPPDRFVLVSSGDATGPSLDESPIREDLAPRPITPYGLSKLRAEEIARGFQDRLSVCILRPCAIYGPRDLEFLPFFRAVRHGVSARLGRHAGRVNMAHARDIASAIHLAGTTPAAHGEVFCVGGPNTTQVELADTIAAALGRKPPLHLVIPGALALIPLLLSSLTAHVSRKPRVFCYANRRRFLAPNWSLDSGKAGRLLGYRPAIDLPTGVADTIAWYRSRGLLSL